MTALLPISVLFEPAARAAEKETGSLLSGAAAVVIDAIRASTTIVAALAAGCREVVPYRTADEVRAEAARRPAGSVVTAGERGGRRIEDLDLNNSPSVMTPERVGGRTLLLTTTNGTQAIRDALAAETVLVAAMPNRRAVAERLAALSLTKGKEGTGALSRIVFVPAGTEGTVSCEDTLVAGAVIEALLEGQGGKGPRSFFLEDSARVALCAWLGAKDRLTDVFRETRGGAAILRLGLDADLVVCAQTDTMPIVPLVRGDPPTVTAG